MSFLVTALVALAAAGAVLGAAFYFGLITTGAGGVAATSPTPRVSFPASSIGVAPTPSPTVAPSPSAAPATPNFSPGGTYVVQPGDALSLIGEKFGIPWQLIAEANGIQPPNYTIQPGETLIIPALPQPSGGGQVYVVVAGDSITKIANKFGIDPTTLADFNNIVQWDNIQVGQILQIPTDNNATPLPISSF
ncbi:MAG TPA: LysM peptidoglycan-binding domain-containing protein [Candidatus Limnocylindrales bacterium]|jgi:LysM repeat protein